MLKSRQRKKERKKKTTLPGTRSAPAPTPFGVGGAAGMGEVALNNKTNKLPHERVQNKTRSKTSPFTEILLRALGVAD